MGDINLKKETLLPKTTDNIGSISHGTLRTTDLLSAFATEIERNDASTYRGIIIEARVLASQIDADDDVNDEILQIADDVMHKMFDILDRFAPLGYYFGAHEGDGSDFGYWSSFEGMTLNEDF